MTTRRTAQSFNLSADAPISTLNITPLIDVMLVLLIMFIITIPLATHKVAIDLPIDTPLPRDRQPPVVHRLDLDAAGRLAWNGRAIGAAELNARLAATRIEPNSELHFRTDAATRYEDFDRVLAAVRGAGITRLGLTDNRRFADFTG